MYDNLIAYYPLFFVEVFSKDLASIYPHGEYVWNDAQIHYLNHQLEQDNRNRSINIAVLIIVLTALKDTTQYVGEKIINFARQSNLDKENMKEMFPGICLKNNHYVPYFDSKTELPTRVKETPAELKMFLISNIEEALHQNGKVFSTSLYQEIYNKSVLSLKALYRECDLEMLRFGLIDEDHLKQMRHELFESSIPSKLKQDKNNLFEKIADPLLTRAEKQHLFHQIENGFTFRAALQNLMWRRYIATAGKDNI